MTKKLLMILLIMTGLLFTACGGGGGSDNNETNTTSDPDNQDTDKDPDNQDTDKDPDSDEKLVYDKNGLVYNIIQGKEKEWLDRNLGATRACKDLDETNASVGIDMTDEQCYGNLYQWGRNMDGHETSLDPIESQARTLNNPTKTESEPDEKFIIALKANKYDWAYHIDEDTTTREARWRVKDGSILCPKGFRVPTLKEIEDEFSDYNATKLHVHNLKFPFAGRRQRKINNKNTFGYYWLLDTGKNRARHLELSSKIRLVDSPLFYGMSIRCTDSNSMPVADAGQNQRIKDLNTSQDIKLDAGNSSDYDDDKLTYKWKLIFPKESSLVLSEKDKISETPTFKVSEEGGYVFSLVVNDGKSESEDFVSVVVGWEEPIVFKEKKYKKIISPFTGKIWLDKNIGADKICEQTDEIAYADDEKCFGGYFQWGRDADLHEYKTTPVLEDFTLKDLTQVGTSFISSIKDINDTNDWDWATTTDPDVVARTENWNSPESLSVCPQGYRVPTVRELENETFKSSKSYESESDVKDNFLKLSFSGHRGGLGDLKLNKLEGFYWTTYTNKLLKSAKYLHLFKNKEANLNSSYRFSYALSVRCVRD